jgi:transposase-like protein
MRREHPSQQGYEPFSFQDTEPVSPSTTKSHQRRYRRAVRARGHFPNEAAALKCLYLVTRSLDPTGGGRARGVMRWKPALNAFAITFAGRFERTTH